MVIIQPVLLLQLHAQEIQYRQVKKLNYQKKNPKSGTNIINIRGYMQVRYNRLLETNPKLKCEQCDKSIGENGGFIIRRGRIIFSGNITKNIYFYIQPDFGSSAGSNLKYFSNQRCLF